MRRKYWTNEKILKHNATYNIVIGGRNLGKSYAIKKYILQKAQDTKSISFMLVRRYDLECKPSSIETYFTDSPIDVITHGEYNTVTARGGTIYFAKLDIETGKVQSGRPCGKYVSLSGATHIKSQAFPTVTDIVFEEFVSTQYLGENEPDLLQHLISTVARSRDVRVWLIGNTVTRLNPYVKRWALGKIAKQEIGTIDDYDFKTIDENGEETSVKIAVEYCSSEGASNKMFFGHVAQSINGGAWECNEHPRLQYNPDVYTVINEILVKYINFAFVIQLLSNDETGELILYAYPYTNKKKYERVLSQDYSENPFQTVWFNKNDECEAVYLMLLDKCKIAFSDNLTGDECISALKKLKSTVL